MTAQRIGDLEIDQDMAYERRFWVFERAGWVVMSLIVGLALLGFFGEGPVSHSRAGDPGQGLTVEYERIARRNAPQSLRFHLTGTPDPEGKVRMSIDRHFLESVQIETMTPEPESVEGRPLVYSYEFSASGGDTTVTFKIRNEAIGRVAGTAGVEGMAPVRFRQFIYP